MESVHTFIPVPALSSSLGVTSFAQSARRTVIHIQSIVAGETLPAGKAGEPETLGLVVNTQQ